VSICTNDFSLLFIRDQIRHLTQTNPTRLSYSFWTEGPQVKAQRERERENVRRDRDHVTVCERDSVRERENTDTRHKR